QGVAPGEVLSLLGYLLPSLIGLSLPMAVLLGTLLGIGRLSGDHEVVAARACGVSLLRLALPIILVGALLYPFEVLIATRIAPWANSQLRSGILELMRTRLTAGLPEKVFNHAFDGLVVYFDRLEPTDHKLINVMISDARNPSTKTKIVARSGFLISRSQDPVVTLRLLDGWMFVEEEHDAGRIIRFDTYDVTAMPHQDSAFTTPTPLELS